MLIYLGWIVAAFLAGVLLAQRKPTLQQRVSKLGILRTMDAPQTETRQTDGRTIRMWRNRDYSISLLFDGREMCLGVEDEGN